MSDARLLPEASGLRHLRWAREILGSLEAHYDHDAELSTPERDLILEEAVKLRALTNGLSAAVKGYRDFLERERTKFRGMLRVARYLVDRAKGEEDKLDALAIQEGLEEAYRGMDVKERAPRKEAVRAAVAELHEGLGAMDRRLSAKLPPALVESLYPALTPDGSRVADDGDLDDDAAG